MTSLRIAMLDVAARQKDRLDRLLTFPHEFVGPGPTCEPVDAVIALRFGAEQSRQFSPRVLHLPGAGADAVALDLLPPGCQVCNVFEHEIPVAEYILAAILDHSLDYSGMRAAFDGENWSKTYAARRPHAEVAGKTLGLVGYGHIGKEVATRARAFGMRVMAVSQSGVAVGADWAGRAADLPEMLPSVDFLVIACPLNDATRGLIDRAAIDLMKTTAVLINVGRAEVADEGALFTALEARRLAGATLDVWYAYPSSESPDVRPSRFPFWSLSNVHCSAHSCAWTEELLVRRYAVIADNMSRLHRSLPLRNIIFS